MLPATQRVGVRCFVSANLHVEPKHESCLLKVEVNLKFSNLSIWTDAFILKSVLCFILHACHTLYFNSTGSLYCVCSGAVRGSNVSVLSGHRLSTKLICTCYCCCCCYLWMKGSVLKTIFCRRKSLKNHFSDSAFCLLLVQCYWGPCCHNVPSKLAFPRLRNLACPSTSCLAFLIQVRCF